MRIIFTTSNTQVIFVSNPPISVHLGVEPAGGAAVADLATHGGHIALVAGQQRGEVAVIMSQAAHLGETVHRLQEGAVAIHAEYQQDGLRVQNGHPGERGPS